MRAHFDDDPYSKVWNDGSEATRGAGSPQAAS
jgi:hypothetical protein